MTSAVIFGCSGLVLTADEAAFFRETAPWGFILFARNIASPDQVRGLIDELRASVGRADAPVLIDQEGGRVARLRPPHWRRYPPGAAFAEVAAGESPRDIAWLGARLMAQDLRDLGINVDCAPVLDVPARGAHDIIGDRAYGETIEVVADIGRAVAEGLMAGGVLPILKHIPGHGRAASDSHLALPVVDTPLADLEGRDFAPFKALADMPIAMTAHVVYAAVDACLPATTSAVVIDTVIRGRIGFDGLLVSDDLSMRALSGDFADRARDALTAGCDIVLHCNGVAGEMAAVAAGCRALEGRAAERALGALARTAAGPAAFDAASGRRRFDLAFGDRFAA